MEELKKQLQVIMVELQSINASLQEIEIIIMEIKIENYLNRLRQSIQEVKKLTTNIN